MPAGVWAYVEGGMGAISQALASSATAHGATIVNNATVDSILYEPNASTGKARVKGVRMNDGSELYAKTGMPFGHVGRLWFSPQVRLYIPTVRWIDQLGSCVLTIYYAAPFSHFPPLKFPVLSNATPYHTFLELLPGLSRDSGNMQEESPLPADFVRNIRYADYSCGAFKVWCCWVLGFQRLLTCMQRNTTNDEKLIMGFPAA